MALEDEESDSWRVYKRLVMDAIERLRVSVDDLRKVIDESVNDLRKVIDEIRRRDLEPMRQDITVLKVKAAMWGALGGLIAGALIGALVSKVIH